MLAHVRALVTATGLPVNADFGNGFADEPDAVARNVGLCVETGVAGLSIEDSTGDRERPLYDEELAADRIAAARAAIDAAGGDVVLTGRAEGFLVGQPDLDAVIRRLRAYAAAGADCLYAPGLSSRAQIAAVVDAVAPKPVNVLALPAAGLTVADLAALGVRRISVEAGSPAWRGGRSSAPRARSSRTDASTLSPTPCRTRSSTGSSAPRCGPAIELRQAVAARPREAEAASAISAMVRPMLIDAVAAGDGAFRTCTMPLGLDDAEVVARGRRWARPPARARRRRRGTTSSSRSSGTSLRSAATNARFQNERYISPSPVRQ